MSSTRKPVECHVARCPEDVAGTGQSVSARTSNLLVVRLHLFRSSIMNDLSNIGLVNSHSKSHGSHHTLRKTTEQFEKEWRELNFSLVGCVRGFSGLYGKNIISWASFKMSNILWKIHKDNNYSQHLFLNILQSDMIAIWCSLPT